MIVAFVGTIDEDDNALPITGNGKTLSMTGYAYKDYLNGREIWSNYWTDFSSKIIGCQEMINLIQINVDNNSINNKLILCVTEMQRILDAVGSDKEQVLFIDNFASQIRKMGCTLYYDTQRFNSIQKRLRIHTNVILIPYKTHFDNKPCYLPDCMKPHKIYVYSHRPDLREARECFNAPILGKHFNTKEFCKDKLVIPKKIKGEIT